MFFEMRFDFGTLDSGERSLPFGLLVHSYLNETKKINIQFLNISQSSDVAMVG